jgi:hypothetical protein
VSKTAGETVSSVSTVSAVSIVSAARGNGTGPAAVRGIGEYRSAYADDADGATQTDHNLGECAHTRLLGMGMSAESCKPAIVVALR